MTASGMNSAKWERQTSSKATQTKAVSLAVEAELINSIFWVRSRRPRAKLLSRLMMNLKLTQILMIVIKASSALRTIVITCAKASPQGSTLKKSLTVASSAQKTSLKIWSAVVVETTLSISMISWTKKVSFSPCGHREEVRNPSSTMLNRWLRNN